MNRGILRGTCIILCGTKEFGKEVNEGEIDKFLLKSHPARTDMNALYHLQLGLAKSLS